MDLVQTDDSDHPSDIDSALPASPDHTRPEPVRGRLPSEQHVETTPSRLTGSSSFGDRPRSSQIPGHADAAQQLAASAHGATVEEVGPAAKDTSEKQARFEFAVLVPYLLRWSKVLDFEFTLWAPDSASPRTQIKMTGRDIYAKLVDGSAVWGYEHWQPTDGDRAVVIDSQQYWFSQSIGDYKDPAECVLAAVATRVRDDRASNDLMKLHRALLSNEAEFYLLEDGSRSAAGASGVASYLFFGISPHTTPPAVARYVFMCNAHCLDEYFRPGTADADRARAMVNYRHFFRASENGAYWAAWFALACAEGKVDLASLVLGSASNDGLVQIASLRTFGASLEAQAKEQRQQTEMLNRHLTKLGRQLRTLVFLLLAAFCVFIYRVLR